MGDDTGVRQCPDCRGRFMTEWEFEEHMREGCFKRARVGWEYWNGQEWEKARSGPVNTFEMTILGFQLYRASVDGSEPRTPAEWLEIAAAHDVTFEDQQQAFAALRDLLGDAVKVEGGKR